MKRKRNMFIIFIFILSISIVVKAEPTCNSIFDSNIMQVLQNDVYTPLKVAAPVLLLIFTTIDFAKAVFVSNEKDGMEKAKSNFVKRGVAALIVFFAPDIINLILSLVDQYNLSSCGLH